MNKRKRRVLFNFFGKLDAENFNKAIRSLQTNQNYNIKRTNRDMFLTTKIIENFINTIPLLITKIPYHERSLKLTILDQLNLSLQIVLQLLIDLENTIKFDSKNILHNSLIKIDHPDEFIHHHFYSKPTINSTTIIPLSPHLIMNYKL